MVQPKRFLPSSGYEEGERVKRQNSGNTRSQSRRLCSEDDEYTTDETSEDEEEEEGPPASAAPAKAATCTVAQKSKTPRRWQPNEDRILADSVKQHGEANWKAIAAKVGSRNHVQCLQRWKKVLRPGLVKGQWSAEEDAMLMKLASSGYKNWGVLSNHMPGRTSKQCRERWCHHLNPSINKGAYTPEEDKIIVEMQARLGNKWSQIAARLPGRTENSIKIRCKALQRKGTSGGSRSTASSPRARKKAESIASKSRRRQCSSSSTASATSGVSAADSAVDQQLSEGGEELPEKIQSSLVSTAQDCSPHLPVGLKFELLTQPSPQKSLGQQQQPPMLSQAACKGKTPRPNAATSFSGSSAASGGASGILASGLVLAPPSMFTPPPESASQKRWWQWSKTSVATDSTMHHSGLPRTWPTNSESEATETTFKYGHESQRLPCLGSTMEHHLVDRPPMGAAGGGGGGGGDGRIYNAPFDGTTMPTTDLTGSLSCSSFDQASLGNYFTSDLNSAVTQQETARISHELACVEQACVTAGPSAGAGMVSSARLVEMAPSPPAVTADKERGIFSFGDFNTLSLEDLKAAVGGDDDEDTGAPLRSYCSFLDTPEDDVAVGDMPLSW